MNPLNARGSGADGAGRIHPRLRALVGTTAGNDRGPRNQEERCEHAIRLRHRKLVELMSRDLREFLAVALLIYGVHFGEHVVLAAVKVDAQGDKHVMGLREGATGNAAGVRALLADPVERWLDTDRSLLLVIDEAKALPKA